jgi:hypothetical protein
LSRGGDGFDIRTFAAGLHAGTVLPAHRHGWGQLVFAASGVMQVVTEDAAWTVPPTRAARLVHAVARLSAGASVTQAALDCGYQSQAAFTEAFVRQFGATPRRFKQ